MPIYGFSISRFLWSKAGADSLASALPWERACACSGINQDLHIPSRIHVPGVKKSWMLNSHPPLHRHKQSMLQSLCFEEKTTLLASHCSIPEPLTKRVAGFIPRVGKEKQKVLLVQRCLRCAFVFFQEGSKSVFVPKDGLWRGSLHKAPQLKDAPSSDPSHVFPGKMQRGLWWQYPSLSRSCLFFSGKRDLF